MVRRLTGKPYLGGDKHILPPDRTLNDLISYGSTDFMFITILLRCVYMAVTGSYCFSHCFVCSLLWVLRDREINRKMDRWEGECAGGWLVGRAGRWPVNG